MGVRSMSNERLLGLTARLLSAAAVLVVVGLGLVVRFMWQQAGQAYGPGGDGGDSGVDVSTRVTMMVFDAGYRPIGVQVLLAAVLVAAAVAVLPRSGPASRPRWVRWEVLGAGVVVLLAVLGFVSVLLYLATTDAAATAQANGFGPMPMTGLMWANASLCAASVAVLAGAGLWWRHPGEAPADVEEESEEDEEGTDVAEPAQASRDEGQVRDHAMGEPPVDYSRDWSPEDFRPPR